MAKVKGKKDRGGLCRYLGKKYHWSKEKTETCVRKANKGKRIKKLESPEIVDKVSNTYHG